MQISAALQGGVVDGPHRSQSSLAGDWRATTAIVWGDELQFCSDDAVEIPELADLIWLFEDEPTPKYPNDPGWPFGLHSFRLRRGDREVLFSLDPVAGEAYISLFIGGQEVMQLGRLWRIETLTIVKKDDTGFHPLDGARFLRRVGAGDRVAWLVAHHSCAVYEARVRGFEEDLLAEFEPEESVTYDALVFSSPVMCSGALQLVFAWIMVRRRLRPQFVGDRWAVVNPGGQQPVSRSSTGCFAWWS